MIRGTTPYVTFTLPFDIANVSTGYITFSQNGSVILDKEKETWDVDGTKATIHLTQDETLRFKDVGIVEIQIAVKLLDGEVLRSTIKQTTANRILKNEPI